VSQDAASTGRPDPSADADQSLSDADQTGSDLDQTASDADQSGSDRDQRSSDRDQWAADQDQALSDGHGASDDEAARVYADTRRTRSQTALERDAVSQSRSDVWRLREETAERRDRDADVRDAAAEARDALALALDREIDQLEQSRLGPGTGGVIGLDLLLRAAHDRRRAAESRARAAEYRREAARDRAAARLDRQRAAEDRAILTQELAEAGVDHLTGALRRRVGLAAIQRELIRTARSDEPCVVAFLDVDGLKAVNDRDGHLAGDALLRGVVACITQVLRRYDLITRYGGDEFICVLSGQDIQGARERFADIGAQIAETQRGARITVGLVECQLGESLEDVIDRADRAMLAERAARAG
jgi:diguanylate cyclase (GGDEF)-like protein